MYALNSGFKAGFRDWPSRRSRIEVSDDGRTIRVPGFRVDIVMDVVQGHFGSFEEMAALSVSAAEDLAWEARYCQLFQAVCSSHEISSDRMRAYYRTLIADHFDPV